MAQRHVYLFEKPDAARNFASWLSRTQNLSSKSGEGLVMVGADHVVTWAIGHLLKLKDIDDYLKEKGIAKKDDIRSDGGVWWRHEHFPFMPEVSEFEFVADKSDEGRYKQVGIIGKQFAAADVIYHAADKDREGQLIGDELIQYFHKEVQGKQIKRLIYSSLDDAAFASAMEKVADNSEPRFKNSGLAAMARAVADAYIGIPGTRVLSSLSPGKGTLSMGRVQTPLLSIICDRFLANRDFKPKVFWTPLITLPDGTVLTMKKGAPLEEGFDDAGRLVDYEVAKRILASISTGNGEITRSDTKRTEIQPPLPFDLPSLQSAMSKKHGLSVDETINACQALYEKKMQTYIGTECRYLPTAMAGDIPRVMKSLRNNSGSMKNLVENADADLRSACWNDSKVAAHHAIIPTGDSGQCSNQAEQIVYEAVCRRYMAQFYPPAVKSTDRLEAEFAGREFSAVSSQLVVKGWSEVESDEFSLDDEVEKKDLLTMSVGGKKSPQAAGQR